MNYNESRKSSTHTEEELKSLTLEDNLTELKRAHIILSRGQPIQKFAIYNNLNNLSKQSGFSQLLILIRDDLITQSEEILNISANKLSQIAKSLNESDQQLLLQMSYQYIRTLSSTLVEGMYEIFGQLWQLEQQASIKLIQELCSPDVDVGFRFRGAKLLKYIPQIELLSLLSVDSDADVRLEIVKSIEQTYQQFSNEQFNSLLSMKIFELIYDCEPKVRMAAIQMFFTVQSKIQNRQQIICKYFYEFLSSSNSDVRSVMSRICGKVFMDIQDLRPDVTKFIRVLHQFSESPIEELRLNFAYNFAGVMQVLEGQCFDHFREAYIDSMLYDCCQAVRDTLMGSLPEVLKQIKVHRAQPLIPIIKKLLTNSLILMNLDQIILNLWSIDNLDLWKFSINELLKEIIKCLNQKQQNTDQRIKQQNNNIFILIALLKLHDQISLCESYPQLLNPLINLLYSDSFQIRQLSSYNIAHLTYFDITINSQIEKLTLWNAKSKMRCNYIDYVSEIITICSKQYFQINNFIQVLKLAQDPITDVRIRLAKVMKKIDSILLETDETIILQYMSAYKSLCKERITMDILKQYEGIQYIPQIEDHIKEQREQNNLIQPTLQPRYSCEDIEQIQIRKRSTGSRQQLSKQQTFIQRPNRLLPLSDKKIEERKSLPPQQQKNRQLKPPTQFKLKQLNQQQRLRK